MQQGMYGNAAARKPAGWIAFVAISMLANVAGAVWLWQTSDAWPTEADASGESSAEPSAGDGQAAGDGALGKLEQELAGCVTRIEAFETELAELQDQQRFAALGPTVVAPTPERKERERSIPISQLQRAGHDRTRIRLVGPIPRWDPAKGVVKATGAVQELASVEASGTVGVWLTCGDFGWKNWEEAIRLDPEEVWKFQTELEMPRGAKPENCRLKMTWDADE